MRLFHQKRLPLLAALCAGALGMPAQAQLPAFTGSYTENFDEIGATGSTLPAGFTSLAIAGGNTTYTAATPISAAGIASATADTQSLIIWNASTAVTKSGTQSYNIGCWDSLTDRAIGTDPTGTAAQVIQLALTNNTGATLYGVTFSYDCKCLTNGSAGTEESELPGYCFFYSTAGTSSAANWNEVGVAGNVVGATNSSGVPIANGLCLPNWQQGTTMSSGPVTIPFATPLTNGGIMYFRWADDNNVASSPDQMIAIDNIGIATYTPAGPVVSLTSPANSASFTPGSSITISANASETGGTITNVAFFAGSTLLGNVTSAPYNYSWTGASVGSYALTAVASDTYGFAATSSAVNVSVAYATPAVSLTSPANSATFNVGASIMLAATASSADATVTNVAFYQGPTLLANVTSAPFTYIWPNVPSGAYTFTAQATDSYGVTGTSSAVSVTVGNPPVTMFTGSYFQNFDQALTNSATTLPPGFVSMVVAGSHDDYIATNPITPVAIASATLDTQSLLVWNAGNAATKSGTQLYNIGCWDSLNDRALGSNPTGTAAQIIQLSMTNTTGGTLYGVVFSYDCQCLTNGSVGDESSELPGYCFFYSLTSGSTNPTDWTEVGVAGDVVGGTNAAGLPIPNGLCLPNYTEGTTMSSGPVTIIFPTPLTNGGVMTFRWADDNNIANSPDQMLAIDNISITAYNPNGPMVSIVTPTNNANYIPGSGVTINVNATDLGTNITSVGLYIGSSLVYTFTSAPYILPIPGGSIPAGSYTLSARVTDAAGLVATSATVSFSVAYLPPTISLSSPANGASFPAPAGIPLSAAAASADGTVTNVAFYQGSTLLANVTSAPFNYTWANVFAGSYNLTALATDSHGLMATSGVVSVTVTNGYGTPLASITSPANNVNFLPGSNIGITANAIESGGAITNIEFYAGSTDLGGVTSAPYSLTWSNVPAGNYALTVVASDAAGLTDTSAAVNVTVSVPHVPPTVSLTSPANNAVLDVANGLLLSATAASSDGTVTNVAFYMNGFLPIASFSAPPYNYTWTNVPTGNYTLTAVATDDSGASTTSSAVKVTATNSLAIATLQQIKTVFVIALENHDWVQQNPQGSPQQIFGNPAAPYVNSLVTPGNSNAVQVSYATHYFNAAFGEHPSEPNYIWSEGGTEFGTHTDNDPSTSSGNVFSNVMHLSGQLTAAGIPWRSYQEDLEYSSGATHSASGSGAVVNPYNGTTEYDYAVKHNPMEFYPDTQNQNCYPLTNFWTDLTNGNIGHYNWITPDEFNEMHSSLPTGYTYHGTLYTSDQAAIAEGDNCLSIIVPRIMASQAYKDHGVIIIWTDETESTDDTNTTLPYIIISPLAKGNAYASTLPYSHSSDLKTMDELFGLAYQTNAIPTASIDAQNTGYNYVDGHSAIINDLSDFFIPANASAPTPVLTIQQSGSTLTNGANAAFGAVNLGANMSSSFTVTNPGNGTLILSNLTVSGANAGDFAVGGLTLPTMVFAGQSATFNVVFAPLGAGTRTASLQITDNDTNNSPFTLALSGTGVLVPPTVNLTGPASGSSFAAPANLALSATAADLDGTVTNVAFYQGTTLLGNATSAPFTLTTANIFAGSYALTAVATDNNGLSATSSVVNITITNTPALAVLQSIKTVFIIAMENHDLVQKNPTGNPQQILGNPAAPYFNSLITPGNPNAAQTAWATHMFSCAINGEHPSEPNYIWMEAGTDFGIRTDDDPNAKTTSHNVFTNVMHLSAQLTAAGIAWRSYQEDLEYTSSEEVSKSGTTTIVNPYNGTKQYNYGVKHNPMAFFPDTQNKYCYPMTNFWTDLTNNNIGRYNWITPDQYNEWHSALSGTYTYNGTAWTGDQSAIASGDNALSIIIPKIMASAAYQDHGVIIIWTDETESTDDTNTTLPYVIISPLAKGNAYASTLAYNHSSDLKTMDEIFGLAYQTNAIPATYLDAQNDGRYDYVDGHSAPINDLSDFFQGVGTDAPALTVQQTGGTLTNGAAAAFGAVNIGANMSSTFTITNLGNGTLVLSNLVVSGANAGDFTIGGLTLPATVYAGQGATFNVVFAPLGAGVRTATVQITDNDTNNNPFTLALSGTGVLVPPTVSLTGPASGASFAAPAMLPLSATAADLDGTVTNVAFYQGTTLLGNATSAPFTFTTANLFAGSYALTAVATDNNGLTATSSVVSITITNTPALAVLQSIKTVFIIAMENHDLVQKNPTGNPQQILGNPAAPYFNSLITPGNPNAAQTAWATHMFSCAINGEHPSEPNYIWMEAGTDFGIRTDDDPNAKTTSHNVFTNVMHLSAQLTAAGIAWRSYQEDLEYTSSEEKSVSGSGKPANPYNGTTQYNYGVKHNPMAFFNDTQNQNCYPMTNFWTDLTNNNIGRYNWITPDQYNEWHSALSGTYTYNGTAWTGDQSAIASGDNALSIIIPKIMASAAYQDHGVIIIWTDETESTDDTNTTLPYVIISPLAKGNAYASTLAYSHSSDLKTLDEIFGLAYQTNAIPAAYYDAQNDGRYDYVDGHSAPINDLSDFFQGVGAMITSQPASVTNNAGTTASFNVGATAPTPLNYQWFFGTNQLAGQTNSALSIASVGPTNVGSYYVVVSSASGSANSAPASLTVIYQAPNVVGGQMVLTPGGGFQLAFSGPSGQTYQVLASDDLTVPQSAWPVLGTGTFGSTGVSFTDPDAVNHPHRYYVIKSP